MASKIRVGIIGQGRSGRNIHADNLFKLKDQFEIVAVSDGMEERRNMAIRDFGCEAYSDYHEMMKRTDLDLIINATPSHLHVPISLELLEAGFNVLCEKPLARKVEEVDQLIAASTKAGKMLAVFQQARFNPIFLKIREIIESGVIGRVVQISIRPNGFARRWDWQTLKSHNGGNLLNTGAHFLDQALQLYGTESMPNVLCQMDSANSFGDAEDYCKIVLTGKQKPLVDIEISSCCSFPGDLYNIQGTNGGITATGNSVNWKYFKPEEAPEQTLQEQPISKPDGSPVYVSETLTWYEDSWKPDGEQLSPQNAFYYMLHAALTEGKPLAVTPEHVRQQIAVMEECFNQNPDFSQD